MQIGSRIFKDSSKEMEGTVRSCDLELPLQFQFAMRKAEIQAKEMTWDELYAALLNLYQRRLVEWAALKDALADENIELEFDVPTQIEMARLAEMFDSEDDDEDDDDDERELSVF